MPPYNQSTTAEDARAAASNVFEFAHHDIAHSAFVGSAARIFGQTLTFVMRLAYIVAAAHLLTPADFGLIAMVIAVTGIYELFSTGGLSLASVQAASITKEQISALFWINILIGTALTILCLLTAPVLVAIYGEPRLFWVTVALAPGFLFSAAGAQHSAILQRQLRYVAISAIETFAIAASILVAVIMAIYGFRYWALVASTLIAPVATTGCMWVITKWIPDPPRRTAGIQSMLRFGCTVTLNGVVSYITANFDKFLLGRFWGANQLGLYGRANQLILIPTTQIHNTVHGMALAVLSRLQSDPLRFRRYFLAAYSLVISATAPMTIFAACFAEDIVEVVLGRQWIDAVPIFRLLAPAVLVLGIINPSGWMLPALGLQGRSLSIALVIAPICLIAYIIGLPYGPSGVAASYSAAMLICVGPLLVWCLKGTPVSLLDYFRSTWPPVLAAATSNILTFMLFTYLGRPESHYLELFLSAAVMGLFYMAILVFIIGDKDLYLKLYQRLFNKIGESYLAESKS